MLYIFHPNLEGQVDQSQNYCQSPDQLCDGTKGIPVHPNLRFLLMLAGISPVIELLAFEHPRSNKHSPKAK
jgi:hypothetical protein